MPASSPAPSLWSARHLAAVLHAVARTSGLAAARRALPLYLGLLLGSSVIFGGNGMSAADVTTLAERSPLFRTVFVLLWLLATTPAVRALVFAREALLLRTLPVPAAQLVLGQALHLVLLEAPLTGLWARGAGVGPALGLLALCATGHALLVAGRRSIALLGPVLLGAALLAAPPRLGPSLLALPLLAWALVRGFRHAPERPPAIERPLVFGPPLWALVTAHLVLLRRSHGAVLLRAAILLVLGLAIAVLAVRNGAYDFLQKPFASDRLLLSLKNALRAAQLLHENERLRASLAAEHALLGQSPAIGAVRMREFLLGMQYGNARVEGDQTLFWLDDGSLRITGDEQLDFMVRMFAGKLANIDRKHVDTVEGLMLTDRALMESRLPEGTAIPETQAVIHAKTGTATGVSLTASATMCWLDATAPSTLSSRRTRPSSSKSNTPSDVHPSAAP